MKFAIGVLIGLGIASIVAVILGEFFPLNGPGGEEFYLNRMGATKFRILKVLGVFTPYQSFWYIGLLTVLSFSMTVCTLRRVGSMWRLAFGKSYKSSKEDIHQMKNCKSIRIKAEMAAAKNKLSRLLRKRFYRCEFKEKNQSILFFAHKGGLARIGLILLHIGLVVAVFGGLLVSLFGYSVYRWAKPGDILPVPERDFMVRIDDFEILTNPQGHVKDYICTLTVLEDGKELRTKKIEVNKPLKHRGITFYQSSYRPDPRHVKSVSLSIRGPDIDAAMKLVQLAQGDTIRIKDSPYSIQMVDFAGNFRVDGGRIFSVPGINEFRNPAVKLNVLDDNQLLIKSGWVFTPRMAGFHNFFEDYRFELVDFLKNFETGLNVRKNPGASWIWCGLVFMTLGVLFIFWMTHKRIWGLIIEGKDGKREIILGGVSNKDKTDFAMEIQSLIKDLKNN